MEQTEAAGVPQWTQQHFRLAEMGVDLAEPAKPKQRVANGEAQIDLDIAALRCSLPLLEIFQCPLMEPNGIGAGVPRCGLGARAPRVVDRLAPIAGARGVAGQFLDVLRNAIGIQFLDRRHDTTMHPLAALVQETGIGRIAHQRVAKRIGCFRRVGELDKAGLPQARAHRRGAAVGHVGDPRQQTHCRRLTDHGSRLQHVLFLRRQTIDALGQQAANAFRQPVRLHGSHQPIA